MEYTKQGHKDYTRRGMVIKMLPWWEKFKRSVGPEECRRVLRSGETKALNRKDRLGLLQALKLT